MSVERHVGCVWRSAARSWEEVRMEGRVCPVLAHLLQQWAADPSLLVGDWLQGVSLANGGSEGR